MPHLLEQISRTVQDQLPKALVGLVIPAGQLIWKAWQDRQATSRAAALRAHITQLAQFLQTPLGDSPSAIAVRESTQEQYDKALQELAELSRPPQVKAAEKPRSPGRDLLVRVFLLYTPRSFKGWVAHTLYYVFLAITVLGTVGLVASGAARDSSDAAVIFMGVYGLIAYALWRWAIRISSPTPAAGRWAWVPLAFIWIAALVELGSLFGASLNDQDDFSLAAFRHNVGWVIWTTAICATAVFFCVRWRKRVNATRPPRPPWAWAPVTLIVIAVYMELGVAMAALASGNDSLSVAIALGFAAVFAAVIVACVFWRRRMWKAFEAKMKLVPGVEEKSETRRAAAG